MCVSLHVFSFSSAPHSVSLGNFPWVSRKCFKCTGVYFLLFFRERKAWLAFHMFSYACRVDFLLFAEWGGGGLEARLTISLSTPSFTLLCPKGTRGIYRAVPPSLTCHRSSKKPLETLLHPNEAILWGFVMVTNPPDPLRGGPFHPLWNELPLFHMFIHIL